MTIWTDENKQILSKILKKTNDKNEILNQFNKKSSVKINSKQLKRYINLNRIKLNYWTLKEELYLEELINNKIPTKQALQMLNDKFHKNRTLVAWNTKRKDNNLTLKNIFYDHITQTDFIARYKISFEMFETMKKDFKIPLIKYGNCNFISPEELKKWDNFFFQETITSEEARNILQVSKSRFYGYIKSKSIGFKKVGKYIYPLRSRILEIKSLLENYVKPSSVGAIMLYNPKSIPHWINKYKISTKKEFNCIWINKAELIQYLESRNNNTIQYKNKHEYPVNPDNINQLRKFKEKL